MDLQGVVVTTPPNLQNSREVVLTRYIVIFTVTNFLMTIAIGVVASILNLKSGSGMAVGAALGASILAASSFVKAHARAPTREETKAFAWRALLATWLVSLVLTAFVLVVLMPGSLRGLSRGLTSGMGLVFVLGAFFVISAIYYLGIRWSFGWYGKQAAARKA
ncbi:MAG: ABZJ_00895 family protein [Polaromonas sp.]|uniref:ABZJ_00895 family protein n=1 Tax=Polaromonas sp. TaxID=1869339 RepID=UPI004035A965